MQDKFSIKFKPAKTIKLVWIHKEISYLTSIGRDATFSMRWKIKIMWQYQK